MNSFDEETFPYEILEGLGLTREMIDDLPGHVLETIGSGGRSPLLPIEIPTKFGSVSAYTKFRITDDILENGKNGMVFYPQLVKAELNMFTEAEKEQLLDGKTILADIDISNKSEEVEENDKEKCFVQIDKDTNHVFYVLASVIGRNINGLDSVIDFSDEDIEKLSNGELVTVTEPEFMTIGIDIFSETGILVCPGDDKDWKIHSGKQMEKYNFGIYGCWINEDGKLRYVKEEDFDEPILEAQNYMVQGMYFEPHESINDIDSEVRHSNTSLLSQEDASQMTR